MESFEKFQETITTERFLTNVTHILSFGNANSTLKWALLMGLIDTAPRFADSQFISLGIVAKKTLGLFQLQTREFPASGKSLRQTSGGKYDLSIFASIGSGASHLSDDSLARMAWNLAQWPVPRLQFVKNQLLPLLYEVPASWSSYMESKGSHRPVPRKLIQTDADGLPILPLLPGGIDALISVGPLLRHAIEMRWAIQVAEINNITLDPELGLREFLFPSESRKSFSLAFRGALQDLQQGRCFWCQRKLLLKYSAVDHVVPWSLSRNDAIENLVLSDLRCNQIKSSMIPDSSLTHRWVRFVEASAEDHVEIAKRFSLRTDPLTSLAWMRSQYRLAADHPGWTFFTISAGEPKVITVRWRFPDPFFNPSGI